MLDPVELGRKGGKVMSERKRLANIAHGFKPRAERLAAAEPEHRAIIARYLGTVPEWLSAEQRAEMARQIEANGGRLTTEQWAQWARIEAGRGGA